MTATKQELFVNVLMNVGEVYDKEITKNMLNIYWKILKVYDLKDIQIAIQQHLLDPVEGRFFPKPAHILAMCQLSEKQSAKTAWDKIDRGIQEVGLYGRIAFDDPIIHIILTEMGGWVRWCRQTQDALERKWPAFRERYQYYAKLPTLPAYPPCLLGLINHPTEPIIFISGDTKKLTHHVDEV
jgi:hypothetical protein